MSTSILRQFSLIALISFLAVPISSDVDTTSSLRGSVNVSGASVEAEHTPTGVSKSTVSGSGGNFSLAFLPVGGPYTVTVSAPGYNTEKKEGLYLVLAESAVISVTLSKADAEEIVVTAQAGSGAFKMGSGTL